MGNATKSTLVYHMVDMDTCSSGSFPFMGTHIVFISLMEVKEEMPGHIFYDFACGLSEYALNRAPSLFANTRFWHDLFHSVGHVCGDNFKSCHVEGL